MKFIQTINSSANKFAKGMVGIFAIKLMLFGGAFLIQSCQTDEIEDTQTIEQEFALLKFEGIVRSSIPRIQSVVEKQQSFTTNSMTTLSIETQQQNEESQMKDILQPVVAGAKELLLSYGFTDEEINDEFGSTENKDVLMAGLAILEIETEANENYTSFNSINTNDLFFMFGQSANAQSYDDFKRCALDATGIAGVGILISEGIKKGIKKLGKKAVLKIVGKALARTLSWVGAAWAIADFSYCMYNS